MRRQLPEPAARGCALRRFLKAPALLLLALALQIPGFGQAVYSENRIPAQGVEIEYTVTIKNPVSHLYDVDVDVRGLHTETIDFVLPAWEPGSYSIRDFAKNVQDFRATTRRNQSLNWEKTDKETWRVAKPPAEDVAVHYQLFSTMLTDDMADISGPSLFMYVDGQKHVPVSVKYNAPGNWKVYTGLERKGDRFHASDYDTLADAPAFIGDHFRILDFDVAKVPHRVVFSQANISMIDTQITSDLQDIVEAARTMFGGRLPYRDYTFLVRVQPSTGSGGIEHLNSSRISVGENDFVSETSYRRFLMVAAHELFHAWNGKRIRPVVLGPFDYTREVHTRLLWETEGVTSYYASLLLVRADIDSPEDFFARMSAQIDELQHAAGRLMMSAEEASWDAWLHSDNADNNTISYYTKGALIGMLLDMEIRGRTRNAKSLDDVMRYLMENYADKGIGFPEDGFLKAVETVAGSDFKEFFQLNVQGRRELDYERYLKPAGLQISIAKQPGTIYAGVEFERTDAGLPRVKRVIAGSPAEKAKLDNGDILISMNGERLTFENFRSRLHSHKIGETLKLTLMRGERLLSLDITPIAFEQLSWNLVEAPEPSAEQRKLLNLWLGIKGK